MEQSLVSGESFPGSQFMSAEEHQSPCIAGTLSNRWQRVSCQQAGSGRRQEHKSNCTTSLGGLFSSLPFDSLRAFRTCSLSVGFGFWGLVIRGAFFETCLPTLAFEWGLFESYAFARAQLTFLLSCPLCSCSPSRLSCLPVSLTESSPACSSPHPCLTPCVHLWPSPSLPTTVILAVTLCRFPVLLPEQPSPVCGRPGAVPEHSPAWGMDSAPRLRWECPLCPLASLSPILLTLPLSSLGLFSRIAPF